MVYNNLFQTVMGGYDENEAVVNHIWDNLVSTQREHAVEHSTEVGPVSALYSDWLTHEDLSQRDNQNIHNEVVRRMAAQTTNASEAPAEQIHEGGEEYDDNELNTAELDSDNDAPPLALRRSPRLSGAEPEYHGLFGSLCTPEEESIILRNDCAFLGKLDLDDDN